jgi:ABC-2 type transport system permease protein
MSQAVLAPVNSASSPAVAFRTLLAKEMLRFWKVSFQTIAAPVLTSVLYLLVFGQVLAKHVEAFPGVSYVAFLIPGGDDVRVPQNAFANSSSSLIQSKISGSLVFVLLPPFSHQQIFGAYVLASIARAASPWLGVFVVAAAFGADVRGPPDFVRT